MSTVLEPLDRYDWREVFKYAEDPSCVAGCKVPESSFCIGDVVMIIAMVDGENDGPDWVGVFELADGRFAVVSAGCDYTGWG